MSSALRARIEDMLANPKQAALLLEFAKERCSEESVLFIQAVDAFRMEMKRQAEEIFAQFIQVDSPLSININYQEQQAIQNDVQTGNLSVNMFSRTRTSVVTLFTTDVFGTFETWLEKRPKEEESALAQQPVQPKNNKKPPKELVAGSKSTKRVITHTVPKAHEKADVTSEEKVKLLFKFMSYTGVTVKDRKFLGKKYQQAFVGSEAADWVIMNSYIKREDVMILLQAWLEIGIFTGLNVLEAQDARSSFYRFNFHLEDLGLIVDDDEKMRRLKLLVHDAIQSENADISKLAETYSLRGSEPQLVFNGLFKDSTTSTYDMLFPFSGGPRGRPTPSVVRFKQNMGGIEESQSTFDATPPPSALARQDHVVEMSTSSSMMERREPIDLEEACYSIDLESFKPKPKKKEIHVESAPTPPKPEHHHHQFLLPHSDDHKTIQAKKLHAKKKQVVATMSPSSPEHEGLPVLPGPVYPPSLQNLRETIEAARAESLRAVKVAEESMAYARNVTLALERVSQAAKSNSLLGKDQTSQIEPIADPKEPLPQDQEQNFSSTLHPKITLKTSGPDLAPDSANSNSDHWNPKPPQLMSTSTSAGHDGSPDQTPVSIPKDHKEHHEKHQHVSKGSTTLGKGEIRSPGKSKHGPSK